MKSRNLVRFLIGSFFVAGIFSGVLFTGYFGTYQNPSPRLIRLMKQLGIKKPMKLKLFWEGLLAENVKIPYHFLKGQFSDPERLFIEISQKNYQKLAALRNKSLLDSAHFASEDDWLPATVEHRNKTVPAKLRLKGDFPDHFDGDKWSLRIKLKEGTEILGMNTFSLQDPKTRFFLNEFFFHEALRREDVMSLRYGFVDVTVNGAHKGIYAVEEHFDTPLISYNQRKNGVFLKFNEAGYRRYNYLKYAVPNIVREGQSAYDDDPNFYALSDIEAFQTSRLLGNPEKKSQLDIAKDLLESFRKGRLKTHEVFDMVRLARYAALVTVLGAQHASSWTNIRFFLNSETLRLEPVGYDVGLPVSYETYFGPPVLDKFFPSCLDNSDKDLNVDSNCTVNRGSLYEALFSDSLFFQKYIAELERVSRKEHLDELLSALDDKLQSQLNILYKDFPLYHFWTEVYYQNQKKLRDVLYPVAPLQVNLSEDSSASNRIGLVITNTHLLPIEITRLSCNQEPPVAPNGGSIVLQPYSSQQPSQRLVAFKGCPLRNPEEITSLNFSIDYKVLGTAPIRQQTVSVSSPAADFLAKRKNNSN